MLKNFNIVILISDLIGIWARYNLIDSFREKEVSKDDFRIKVFVMGLFYFVSYTTYFLFDIPIVNLLIQIFFLTIIAWILNLRPKKILHAVTFTIIILVSVESSVVFATGYVSKAIFFEANYNSVYGIVASNLITYTISMGIRKHKNIRKNIEVPLGYWGVISFFPLASLVLLLNIFELSIYNTNIVTIGIIMVLFMNLMMFSLYDRLVSMYEKEIKTVISQQMNMSYKNQLRLMKGYHSQVKSFQHDFNKHISTIDTLASGKHYEELEAYIHSMKIRNPKNSVLSNTGNVVIDSIVNFEISNSNLNHDNIFLRFNNIPPVIGVEDYDITVLLSNIIQNALVAASRLENGKVYLNASYIKCILYISIQNDFDGKYKDKDDSDQTIRSNKDNHGYGLLNVKAVVEKYDGKMKIRQNDKKFITDILLYTKTND
ncbi:sensor histidine kinase [Fusibacter bizertensis]